MYCSKCGTTNDSQAQFCVKCGTPLGTGSQESLSGKMPEVSENVSLVNDASKGRASSIYISFIAMLASLFISIWGGIAAAIVGIVYGIKESKKGIKGSSLGLILNIVVLILSIGLLIFLNLLPGMLERGL